MLMQDVLHLETASTHIAIPNQALIHIPLNRWNAKIGRSKALCIYLYSWRHGNGHWQGGLARKSNSLIARSFLNLREGEAGTWIRMCL
jgi:hypothetical protein